MKEKSAKKVAPAGAPLLSERALSFLILAVVMIATAVGLWPEIAITRVDQSDAISHFTMLDAMVHTVEQGGNPIDFWAPEITFGAPVFRTYQPLAHGLVAAAYFALGKTVSVVTLFSWTRFLAIWLLPLTFFFAASLLELPPLACAAAALLAPMISTVGGGLFGIEYRSYIWLGFGLFPQSVAAHTLLLSIGFGWQSIRHGRRVTLTGILLGLTCLLHFIYGWLGAVTIVLLALLPNANATLRTRIVRTLWIGLTSLALAIFQLLPLLRDSAILNRSRLEPAVKFDSYGATQILTWLFSGDLFDFLRVPVLTLLVAAGVALAGWRMRTWRENPRHLFLLAGTLFWLLIYFGRGTWGPLLYLIGATPDLHLHRVLGGFQIFSVLLAALALEALWRALGRRSVGIALAATLVLLFPMVRERAELFGDNASQGAQNLAAWDANRAGVDAMIASARQSGGRAYAGLGNNWGAKFKIGLVPFFAALSVNHIPAVSFIYNNLALPSDIMMQFDETNPAHYRLFNVRTAILPARPGAPAYLVPRTESGGFRAYDAPGGGYFDLVDVTAPVSCNRETFFDINDRWLHGPDMPRRRHLLLNFFGDAPASLPPVAESATGSVVKESQSGQEYSADLSVARPSFALFKMTWHPNWKVTVDGAPQKTAMLSPGFLGVRVEPGTHHIECRYQGDGWRLWLALAGVLVVAATWLTERRYSPAILSSSRN